MQLTEYFCHLGSFFVLLPPYQPDKWKYIKKKEKMHWDIIVLHKCTKNHDHRLPCSWDMACDGCNCYFSFWAFFCPFTLLIAKKWKFQRNNKKKNNNWRYHHLRQVYQKSWSCALLFLRYGMWQMQLLFFILGFFAYLAP